MKHRVIIQPLNDHWRMDVGLVAIVKGLCYNIAILLIPVMDGSARRSLELEDYRLLKISLAMEEDWSLLRYAPVSATFNKVRLKLRIRIDRQRVR